MRRAAKIDGNHESIALALRRIGCSVQSLAAVGRGCPDLLIGVRGQNLLLELKDGSLVPSQQRLTEDQAMWHRMWRGQVAVIRSVDEALEMLRLEAN